MDPRLIHEKSGIRVQSPRIIKISGIFEHKRGRSLLGIYRPAIIGEMVKYDRPHPLP